MEPLAAVVIIVAFAILSFAGDVLRAKKRQVAWQDIADRLGLRFVEDEIRGQLHEVDVRVWTYVSGSGKNRSTWTAVEALIDGRVPAGLTLTREGVIAKIGKVTGTAVDIQLDLPGLDDKLQVRASDPDEVRRWAQRSDVSRALVDLAELPMFFEVVSRHVRVELPGSVHNAEELEPLIEQLVDLSRALSGKGYGALIDERSW